jgi:hypothetical protein
MRIRSSTLVTRIGPVVLFSLTLFSLTLFSLIAVVAVSAADLEKHIVIYDGAVTEVASQAAGQSAIRDPQSAIESPDLWVTLKDLTRATRFVLKPQGVCLEELCFPIPKARRTAFLRKEGKVTWFNLTEFARLIKQPVAHDAKHSVWYFGQRRDAQNGFLESLEAPDFTLPDANGKMRSLSEFRGKKVLLITWASW